MPNILNIPDQTPDRCLTPQVTRSDVLPVSDCSLAQGNTGHGNTGPRLANNLGDIK